MSVTETSGHGMFSLLLSQLLHHRDSLTAGYNSSGTYFHTAIASRLNRSFFYERKKPKRIN
jgi:hypothetical protein